MSPQLQPFFTEHVTKLFLLHRPRRIRCGQEKIHGNPVSFSERRSTRSAAAAASRRNDKCRRCARYINSTDAVGRPAVVNLAAVDRDLSFGATRPFAGAWDSPVRRQFPRDLCNDSSRFRPRCGSSAVHGPHSVITIHPPPRFPAVCWRSADAHRGHLATPGRSRILRGNAVSSRCSRRGVASARSTTTRAAMRDAVR